jgi:hypothetical protein
MTGSGYTFCACRDCFEETVSSHTANLELCTLCLEAGCDGDGGAGCSRNDLDIGPEDLRLDHIPDVAECRKLLARFEAESFWPDVYHVNDHGNVELLCIGHNGARIVRGWV